MTDTKRNVLRVAARALLLISFAIQILFIAYYWWSFDTRLSCNRLQYWGEWIQCLHGESHLHIRLAEIAILSWPVSGLAWLLGRYLPPYISAIVPAGLIAAFVRYAIGQWHANVVPYAPFGETTFWDLLSFVTTYGLAAVYLLGPVVGTWLLGFATRVERRRLRVSTAT